MDLLMKNIIVGVALLLLAACNLIDEGETESGISGDGVVAGSEQTHVGDGSPSDWVSSSCRLVDGNKKWRFTSKYVFDVLEVDPEEPNDIVRIDVLEQSFCEIDSETKIAYTTKNWLCKDDYVKINGSNCLITAITDDL